MAQNDTDRLDELEILAAHQARTIEDLNETIIRQGKDIDRLERLVEALVKRFKAVEDHVQPEIAATKPPHW
ncbi:SlyX family protein [Oricola sp.]|uniref:SlyX family protein n=1 Tax=Oricola sp. TaxID=1979950 RepID=UPI0025FF0E95|nr:SlyX family protein [Oricola sp.]MCI5077674.1 SlyX family protein [Oricola sp.]